MNDNLTKCIEKYIFHSIDNEIIMQWFQNMKTRRNQLLKAIMSLYLLLFVYINNVYRFLTFFFFFCIMFIRVWNLKVPILN
jgi:hypothetical protein